MTDEEYIEAFKKLDAQFEIHLKLYQLEQRMKLAEEKLQLAEKQLLKKRILAIEQFKRMSGL